MTETLDMSMTARYFTQRSVGDAQEWMQTLSSNLEATAVQGKPHVQEMLLLVCLYCVLYAHDEQQDHVSDYAVRMFRFVKIWMLEEAGR